MRHCISIRFFLVATGITALAMGATRADLTVTFNFTDFGDSGAWSNLHNDAWGGSTPDSVKQAAAESVIRAAGDYWEAAFAGSTTAAAATLPRWRRTNFCIR